MEGEEVTGAFVDDESTVAVFRGMPFAAPPVGELRWRPPAAVSRGSGPRSAIEFGPRCPQFDSAVRYARDLARDFGTDPAAIPELAATSEDCLFLNVWTSNLGGAEPQPVMVWIHGGSNVHGSGDEVPADGANLARRGVVVVTFNYRLGVFGFLAHPELTAESEHRSSGNYGLLDQVAALEWVNRNIAAFGGDPQRVTVFGASAGGADVHYLMSSPLTAGLFHRAISQSGSPVGDQRTLEGQERRGLRLQELLGIGDSKPALDELRAMPVERLMDVTPELLNQEFDCAPVADGWAVPDLPGRVFAQGRQHDVPLMVGSNSDEWTTIGRYGGALNAGGLEAWLRSRWGAWADRAARVYALEGSESVMEVAHRWQTDNWFTCPAQFTARAMETVSSPAYLYTFSRRLPAAGERLGAYHGAETAYVFDNLAAESWIPREDYDRELASAMAGYWTQFARSGDPNVDGLPTWPAYGDGGFLELGDEIVARTSPPSQACQLWTSRMETELELR